MARERNKSYIDVVLTEIEVKRIKKGNSVHRHITVGGKGGYPMGICVKIVDKKVNRKIAKLEAQLKEAKKKLKGASC